MTTVHGISIRAPASPFTERIVRAYPGLSPVERKVADVLLKDPLQFTRISTAMIGAAAGVSAPSIMRFCRAVGCNGLTDLKQSLLASLARYDSGVTHQLAPPRAGIGAADILDQAEVVLRHLRGQLDSQQAAEAVALLAAAPQIVCVGAYQLGPAALYARDSLLRHGLAASVPLPAGTCEALPQTAAGLIFCLGMPDAPLLDSITHLYRQGAGVVLVSDVPLATFVPSSVRLVLGNGAAPAAGAPSILGHCLMTDMLVAGIVHAHQVYHGYHAAAGTGRSDASGAPLRQVDNDA